MIRTMVPSLFKERDEQEQEAFRSWLQGILINGVADVEFTKKDGTVRKMQCTLKQDLVAVYEKKTDKIKPSNNEVCAVFDLEKQEWRSFRYDSINKVVTTLFPDLPEVPPAV